MKKQSVILYEMANILCWFRIVASVLLAIMVGKNIGFAILFALAFISDVLDGWYYRKFASERPYKHWFNQLPITMDPIADFFLVGGGVIHVMDNKLMGLLCLIQMATVMLLWNWLGRHTKGLVYTVLMTGLTYYWFAMMITTVIAVWRRDGGEYWMAGAVVTVVLFYGIWLKTRVKSRTIRRRG